MTATARTTLILAGTNVAVFVALCIAAGIFVMLDRSTATLTDFLSLPASVRSLAHAPLSPVTYMFTHTGFIHLAVNMLWLIGFGAMFRGSSTTLLLTYLAGGLAGAAAYLSVGAIAPIISNSNLIPEESVRLILNSPLSGSSAAVMAVVTATAILTPDRKVSFFFLNGISLKWVAASALFTILVGPALISLMSAPGFAAGLIIYPSIPVHIAGMMAGISVAFILKCRERNHQKLIRDTFSEAIPRHQSSTRIAQETHRKFLLNKAETSGFSSLSDEERRILFNVQSK